MDIAQPLKEEFTATAYGLDGDNKGQRVVLRFSSEGFVILQENGGQTLRSVGYHSMAADLGGHDGQQLVLTAETGQEQLALYIRDPEVFPAFLLSASADQREKVEALIQQRMRKRTIGIGAIVIAILIIAGLGILSVMSVGHLESFVVEHIPPEVEKKIGKVAVQEILKQQKVVTDAEIVRTVDAICTRLVSALPANPYQFKFTVVQSDQVNAFAFPGGQIVIFSSLLGEAESSEEVAGVLAHEIQHVLRRHSVRRIVRGLGLVAGAQIVLGDFGGILAMGQQVAEELLILKFGRDQESEADTFGLELLIKAQINPSGMPSFFEKLARKESELTDGLTFMSSHPGSRERAKELKKRIAALKEFETKPIPVEWESVRGKVKALNTKP